MTPAAPENHRRARVNTHLDHVLSQSIGFLFNNLFAYLLGRVSSENTHRLHALIAYLFAYVPGLVSSQNTQKLGFMLIHSLIYLSISLLIHSFFYV